MDNNPKSQVVERLRQAQNVLITVSTNPSVDQLAAAIGFTLMMNKLGKHATAVFSGAVPSTIEFLKPEDTLETNTDSLRDFIISLDKAKADKLRYKVEENVVKIFITPYKTSLGQDDFDFSQGDFNVDVVIALGVDQKEHIDKAIVSHGRILHDATVIGVMAGQNPVDVGSINWQDPTASSLCEMLVSISEAFQSGLLDSQMATAYLTGIVAETERFSNDKTSPKVMTMSAQLMAAGANQQLIATKLAIPTEVDDGVPANLPPPKPDQPVPLNENEGVLSLHDNNTAESTKAEEDTPEAPQEPIDQTQINIDAQGKLETAEDLAKAVQSVQAVNREEAAHREKVIQPPSDQSEEKPQYSAYMTEPPTLGGTLNASAEPEALEPSTDPLSAAPSPSYPEPDNTEPSPDTPDNTKQNNDKNLGPDISDDKTLTQIESAVQDYTGKQVHEPDELAQDAEAARKAVLDAVVAGGYDANRPSPLESLGAQDLSGSDTLHESEPTNSGTATPPPPVPPPLPLPHEDTNKSK